MKRRKDASGTSFPWHTRKQEQNKQTVETADIIHAACQKNKLTEIEGILPAGPAMEADITSQPASC